MVERKDLVSYDMKRSLWVIILFLLTGILCAQLLGSDFFGTYGYLGEYQLQSFAACSLDWMDLFWNILMSRCRLFILFALFCSTPLKRLVLPVAKVLTGFVLGFFAAACVMQLGGFGLLFFAFCIFPHTPFYFLACVGIYRLQPTYTGSGKRKNLTLFLSVFRICLCCLAGCVCETWVGTRLIRWVLSLAY